MNDPRTFPSTAALQSYLPQPVPAPTVSPCPNGLDEEDDA